VVSPIGTRLLPLRAVRRHRFFRKYGGSMKLRRNHPAGPWKTAAMARVPVGSCIASKATTANSAVVITLPLECPFRTYYQP
jgi:hypothetical protein